MNRPAIYFIFVFILALSISLASPSISVAESVLAPELADSAFDLINAVNVLRTSNGLPAYSINPILMFTAQNQADFIAATGSVTHSGPGGISVTDRLLLAGYPLAGDLSLGGFRSENIAGGSESMSAQSAVDQWTGDAPHLNTMLSPNLTEIGAGVSVSNGRVYYVIDAARPTTSGAPQAVTTVFAGGSDVPANEAPAPAVIINTPDVNGDVIYEVLSGQTLWQIAVSYNAKIDDIKRLNNLSNDSIYPGEKLLIKQNAVATDTPTKLAELTKASEMPTFTFTQPPTRTLATATSFPNVVSVADPTNSTIIAVMIGIIALAVLGGGLFTWFGNAKHE